MGAVHLKSDLQWQPAPMLDIAPTKPRAQARRILDGDHWRLSDVFFFGRKHRLESAQLRAVRRAGLSHLLALSGLHLSVILALVWIALRPFVKSGAWLASAVTVCLVLYRLLVGGSPSLERATAVVVLALVARLAQRRSRGLDLWVSSGCVLLMLSFDRLSSLSFQLSFAATGAILLGLILDGGRHRLRNRFHWARQSVVATVWAQWATLPLILPVFASLHPLGWMFNLLASPWLALVLATSALGGALVSLGADPDLAALVHGFSLLEMPLSGLTALGPSRWMMVLVAAPSWVIWCLCAAILLASTRWGVLRVSALGAMGIAVWLVFLPRLEGAGAVRLAALDVGQGDAILLSSGREHVLVDGGGFLFGEVATSRLIPYLASRGITRLSAVAVTHDDVDHCRGLLELVSYIPVDAVWTGPSLDPLGCAARLGRTVGPQLHTLWRGRTLQVGQWHFKALHPAPKSSMQLALDHRGLQSKTNESSLVLLAEASGVRVLLTGDLPEAQERELLLSVPRQWLKADILKVGHHGSRSSTGLPFLASVDPRMALISAGARNSYGHPHPDVLRRLSSRGVLVARTDLWGTIELEIDSSGWVVRRR